MPDFTYFYHGFLYKWEQNKADKRFLDDRICIQHCCQAIFDCQEPIEQPQYSPSRWKYVGLSDVGIITVIKEEDETRIVWKASRTESNNANPEPV